MIMSTLSTVRKSVVLAVVGCMLLLFVSYLVYQNSNSMCQADGLIDLSSIPNFDTAINIVSDGSYNFSSHASQTPKRYMFTLRIPEQLTMSSIHFHQFLNLVNDWNFTGVEPFIYGSTMYGLRSLHPGDPNGSLPFSLLFNATKHNDYLSKCMKRHQDPEAGYPVLFEPMREFLRHSYRQLVLVYFASHENTLTCSTQITFERLIEHEKDPIVDCSRAAHERRLFNYVEGLLRKEITFEQLFSSSDSTTGQVKILDDNIRNFRAVQAFCVKQDIIISLKDLKRFVLNQIKEENGHNFSIIFISWQGRFTHPFVSTDVKNYINKCRLPFSQPLHSDFVMNAARLYVESLGFRGAPYLSVHVRFEKLYIYAKRMGKSVDTFLDCCMRRLNSLLSAVTGKFNNSKNNILLNWDYSPYGSLECPIWWCGHVTNKHLKKIKATPSYFEPKKFGIPVNHGLISLVEMNALFGGKALVTVGEGSYQTTIIESFIEHHHDPSNPEASDSEKLHYGHLCIPEENLHDLSGSITPRC